MERRLHSLKCHVPHLRVSESTNKDPNFLFILLPVLGVKVFYGKSHVLTPCTHVTRSDCATLTILWSIDLRVNAAPPQMRPSLNKAQ